MEEFPFEVIPTPEQSELEAFACWFHQDWRLVFSNFQSGAEMYIDSLPSERSKILATELRHFLSDNANSADSDLRQAWFSLGAEAWQRDLKIKDALRAFLEYAEEKEDPSGQK